MFGPAVALSDTTVITATVYPSSGGSVSSQSVSLGTLDGCPLYSGSSPMYLYPGDQPYSPAVASSWSLATVLSCALRLPLSDVTDVQVDNPANGFEAYLDNAQLSDPSQYHDPNAPDALPVVSVDGSETQFTYTRPWLGGSDENAADQVVSNGSPLGIVVYENGPPLQVNASSRTLKRSASALEVRLSATVHTPSGAPVPASELSWSWNFGDGASSARPRPRHSFAPGVYPVTVQVTDNANGMGGTDTLTVTFNSTPRSGSGSHGGAGANRRSHSPSGPVKSTGTDSGGVAGKPSSGRATTAGDNATTGAASSPGQPTAQPSTSTLSPPPSAAESAAAAQPHVAPLSNSSTSSRPSQLQPLGTQLVSGRLISDLTPVAADASPLVQRAATATAVHAAVSSSVLPAVAGCLTLGLLFGLGAAHELGTAGLRAKLRRLLETLRAR